MSSPVVVPSLATRRTALYQRADDRKPGTTSRLRRYGSQPASRATRMASTRFRAFILVTTLVR
jgi:hypothetical protein